MTKEDRSEKIDLFNFNMLFLLISLLLLTLGSYVQQKNFELGILFTQYILVLAIPIIYMKYAAINLNVRIFNRRANTSNILVTLLIVVFAYPIGIVLNYLAIALLSKYGKLIDLPIPNIDNSSKFLKYGFILAISPGICEEYLFRGIILNGYSGFGKRKAIILSSVLFGIFHFNLQNLLAPIFMGLVFGNIVWKTGSLYLSMIGHAFNNLFALYLSYKLSSLGDLPASSNTDIDFKIFNLLVVFLLSSFVLVFLFSKLKDDRGEKFSTKKIEYVDSNSLVSKIPILLVVGIYILINVLVFL